MITILKILKTILNIIIFLIKKLFEYFLLLLIFINDCKLYKFEDKFNETEKDDDLIEKEKF